MAWCLRSVESGADACARSLEKPAGIGRPGRKGETGSSYWKNQKEGRFERNLGMEIR